MPTSIITTDDLREFKMELLEQIKILIADNPRNVPREWLRSADVLDKLKISPGKLQNLRAEGTLPYTRIGGLIYYDSVEIDELLESNKINNQY